MRILLLTYFLFSFDTFSMSPMEWITRLDSSHPIEWKKEEAQSRLEELTLLLEGHPQLNENIRLKGRALEEVARLGGLDKGAQKMAKDFFESPTFREILEDESLSTHSMAALSLSEDPDLVEKMIGLWNDPVQGEKVKHYMGSALKKLKPIDQEKLAPELLKVTNETLKKTTHPATRKELLSLQQQLTQSVSTPLQATSPSPAQAVENPEAPIPAPKDEVASFESTKNEDQRSRWPWILLFSLIILAGGIVLKKKF